MVNSKNFDLSENTFGDLVTKESTGTEDNRLNLEEQ